MLIPANSKEVVNPEKWYYIGWLTHPVQYRRPQTQKELAEYLHVHPATLTRWKGEPFVRQTVLKLIARHTVNKLPEVLDCLYAKAMEGSPVHIRMFMEYSTRIAQNDDSIDDTEAQVETSKDHLESKYGPAVEEGSWSPNDWMQQLARITERKTSHPHNVPSPQS